jgi:hypothetical protein
MPSRDLKMGAAGSARNTRTEVRRVLHKPPSRRYSLFNLSVKEVYSVKTARLLKDSIRSNTFRESRSVCHINVNSSSSSSSTFIDHNL